MTCAQGLLRLLWGGPEVGVLRDCKAVIFFPKFLESLATSCLPVPSVEVFRNWACLKSKQPTISQIFTHSFDEVDGSSISRLWEGAKLIDMYFQD